MPMSFHFDIFNYIEAAREMQLSVWLSKLKYNNRPNWAKDTHQNELITTFFWRVKLQSAYKVFIYSLF